MHLAIVYLHSKLEASGRFIGFAGFHFFFNAHIKLVADDD